MINRSRIVKTFLSLVKIDSVSRREGKIMRFLKKELEKLGIKSRFDNAHKKFGGEAGNLIGVFKGSVKGAKTLMLNAHVDTVASGVKVVPCVRGNIISSAGKTILGADDKAGVAAILEAIKVLREKKIPHGDIVVLFTVAEEVGLYGAKAISKRAIKADLGFAIDGGRPDVILNRGPSQDNLKAKIIGKAAHAGVHPERGINAIKVASQAISSMKLGRIDKETTANIGIIKGGLATNIIPDLVLIKGEARSLDPKKLKAQIAHMKNILKKACSNGRARAKIRIWPEYRSFYVAPGSKVFKIIQKAAKKVGLDPVIESTGGGSDANIFNKIGIPTLILGAGAKKVHTDKEILKINEMMKCSRLLVEAASEITKKG